MYRNVLKTENALLLRSHWILIPLQHRLITVAQVYFQSVFDEPVTDAALKLIENAIFYMNVTDGDHSLYRLRMEGLL